MKELAAKEATAAKDDTPKEAPAATASPAKKPRFAKLAAKPKPSSTSFMESFRLWCAMCWGIAGTYVLIHCTFVYFDIGNARARVLHGQVHPLTYIWPFISFSTGFVVNFITLFYDTEPTKLSLSLLGCYINGLAALSDVFSLMGQHTMIQTSLGPLFNLERMIMWMYTTPAMLYMMTMVSNFDTKQVQTLLSVDVLMLCFGMAGMLSPRLDLAAVLFTLALSCFYFVTSSIWGIFTVARRNARCTSAGQNLAVLSTFTLALWLMFPVTYLCMVGGVISSYPLAEALWCTLDFFGKFYLRDRVQVVLEINDLEERKERFLSLITHELRTPLNGIIGLSDGILAQETLEFPVARMLGVIKASGLRLMTIVNDILDSTSIRMGKLTVKHERVSLQRVVWDVTTLIEPMLKRNVELITDIPDDMPEVFADAGRVMQILSNLVGNSCKFTERGHIQIAVRLAESAGLVEVDVSDTGLGIPAHKHESIFEAFEQVDVKTTRKYGGTGLGLSLVKQLVLSHGGHIWVKSKLGEGSTFTFTLKLYKEKQLVSKRFKNKMKEGKGDKSLVEPLYSVAEDTDGVLSTSGRGSHGPPARSSMEGDRLTAHSLSASSARMDNHARPLRASMEFPAKPIRASVDNPRPLRASMEFPSRPATGSRASVEFDRRLAAIKSANASDTGRSEFDGSEMTFMSEAGFLYDAELQERLDAAAQAERNAAMELNTMTQKYVVQVRASGLLSSQVSEMEAEINRLQDLLDTAEKAKK